MSDVSLRDYARAVRTAARQTSVKSMARRPLERQAQELIDGARAVDASELTGGTSFIARLMDPSSRHAWSLHAPDQLVLQALVSARGVRTAFEIGTFNGGTTRVIAEALPDDGQMWTLDLPPADFDRTQSPENFGGHSVGREYRDSPAAGRITQFLEDSVAFDPAPFEGRCDLVLVDGAHDHEHGVADTLTAFRLVAPGGIVIWDDFTSYWHGLVRGIFEAAGHRTPRRLAGSNLGVWCEGLRD